MKRERDERKRGLCPPQRAGKMRVCVQRVQAAQRYMQ